jgi:hypothetical protein
MSGTHLGIDCELWQQPQWEMRGIRRIFRELAR